MANDEDDVTHVSGTEAKAGSTPGVARNVLIWGLVLVVLIFALILFFYR